MSLYVCDRVLLLCLICLFCRKIEVPDIHPPKRVPPKKGKYMMGPPQKAWSYDRPKQERENVLMGTQYLDYLFSDTDVHRVVPERVSKKYMEESDKGKFSNVFSDPTHGSGAFELRDERLAYDDELADMASDEKDASVCSKCVVLCALCVSFFVHKNVPN